MLILSLLGAQIQELCNEGDLQRSSEVTFVANALTLHLVLFIIIIRLTLPVFTIGKYVVALQIALVQRKNFINNITP